MAKLKVNPNNPIKKAIDACRQVFITTFIFAFGVNLLMLITPLYSLQVLDRVISTGSKETLLMLTLLMTAIYVALTLLQIARSFTLIKIGEWLDAKLTPILFSNSVSIAAIRPTLGANQSLRELETVKAFLTSIGINSLFDAPWSIIYLGVLYIIHPYLFFLTLFGAVLLFGLAILNAYATSDPLNKANEFNMRSMNQAEIATRNAEVVEAMGMINNIVDMWHSANFEKQKMQSSASLRNGIVSNFSKFIRMILQMLVTAIGAYLTLQNQISVGGMIASSIIVGRALAPLDAAIETWKQITGAKKSYERLVLSLESTPSRMEAMALPKPQGRLVVENILYAPPPSVPNAPSKYIVRGVSFVLEPGEVLAVIGPSASGKTSLSKLIMGIWKPNSGVVRLDGADVYSWNRLDFGKHAGYMPQGIELFNGTVKDNIARMNKDANPEDIVSAAKFAGVHDLILHLPNGYETDIGIGGSAVSAGQRQRIALARAFYGDPKLVVLDEPNANLDEIGEMALVGALNNARNSKITTIIISHRPSILSSVDKILIMQEGVVVGFGPRQEILAKLNAQAQAMAQMSNRTLPNA